MPDSILVVVEQREGKLNRVSWETLTAGQALSSETGWPLEAAVVGSGIDDIAGEDDEIWREPTRHVDDPLHVRPPHRRPDVEIADLHDPQSVEIRRQPLHRNIDTADVRAQHRDEHADADGDQRAHRHPGSTRRGEKRMDRR